MAEPQSHTCSPPNSRKQGRVTWRNRPPSSTPFHSPTRSSDPTPSFPQLQQVSCRHRSGCPFLQILAPIELDFDLSSTADHPTLTCLPASTESRRHNRAVSTVSGILFSRSPHIASPTCGWMSRSVLPWPLRLSPFQPPVAQGWRKAGHCCDSLWTS